MTVPSRCDAAEPQVRRRRARAPRRRRSRARSARTVSRTRSRSKAVGHVVDAPSAPTADRQQRAERVDERQDRAAVEGELRRHQRRPRPAPRASASARSGRQPQARRPAPPAPAARSEHVERAPAPTSSGKPRRTVSIAFAWISAPDISSSPGGRGGVDVLQRRGRRPDDARSCRGRSRVWRLAARDHVEKETGSIVPGGPR